MRRSGAEGKPPHQFRCTLEWRIHIRMNARSPLLRPLCRIPAAVAATVLALALATAAPASAQDAAEQAWVEHTFPTLADGLPVCAAVLADPDDPEMDGAVQWAFNTARRDALPNGYLSIAPGLLPLGQTLVIDNARRIPLEMGPDGYLYVAAADIQTVLDALRRGLEARVGDTPGSGRFTLVGFTAATEAARQACGG